MSILINKNSKIVVQGFTGKEATFHSKHMISYGTNILSGVSPGKLGYTHLGKPVFNTVEQAIRDTGVNVSIIFVPPLYAADAILESFYAGIEIVICITEGIPLFDMMKVKHIIKYNKKFILIGPNCPGIITPLECKVGIMPNFIFNKKGSVGIISRSGTLTYEVADQIMQSGYGISTAVGIGGDAIIGSSMKKLLKLFILDKETKLIVLIGEIGGSSEIEASMWYNNNKYCINKPVLAFIAGKTAPKGKTMGHAGAIVNKYIETAEYKISILKSHGITILNSISTLRDIKNYLSEIY
jgi:succinyl-CoA synthetase alpha subunit